MYLRGLIFIALVFAIVGCSKENVALQRTVIQPAKVMVVKAASNGFNRQIPGTVRASQRVQLAFHVAGQLKYFPLKEGQKVTKGEVLGRLDDRDYRSNLSAAMAEFSKNRANLKRTEELLATKFISQAEYDGLKAALEVSASNLEKANKALDDAELKAPFTGTIAKRYVENFQDIQAKQPIVSLQDYSQLEVVISVSESLISRHNLDDNEGLILSAEFNAFPGQEFELFLKEYSTEADSKTQTFDIVLGIKQTSGIALLPGMTAKVHAQIASTLEDSDTFLVPLHAVVADEEEHPFVWVVSQKGDTVSQKQVVLGDLKGSDSIEAMGLEVGDVVVVGGVTQMREGKVIRPIEKVVY